MILCGRWRVKGPSRGSRGRKRERSDILDGDGAGAGAGRDRPSNIMMTVVGLVGVLDMVECWSARCFSVRRGWVLGFVDALVFCGMGNLMVC